MDYTQIANARQQDERAARSRYTIVVTIAIAPARPLLRRSVPRLSARQGIVAHLAVFGLFVMLAVIWLRPLPWQMADHVTGPGDPLTTAWRLVWPGQWLMQRDAPFWQTNVLYPASNAFARDELTLGDSLIAGPIYAGTRNALVAYNLTLLLTLALSGFTMYGLTWHLLRHRAAGIIAGIIFALAPYHLAQLDHVGLLAVQWLPLIVLFLDRTLRTRRWRDAALLALVIDLQALSAGYYAYWSAAIIALYLGYVALSQRRLLTQDALGRVGGAFAVAFLALVPVILPFRAVATAEAWARPMREVEYWSARPQTWLAATPTNLIYGRLVRAHAWTWSTEMYLFPGALAVALAVVAVVTGKRGWLRWYAVALTCGGFVLTLGPFLHLARRDTGRIPLPYLLLYRLVPGGDALRAPVRAAPIAMLGLALLAGIGWKRLAALMRKRQMHRWASSLAAMALCIALCGEYATAPVQTVRVPQLRGGASSLADWLRAQPPSVVALLPDLRAPVAMALATTNRHRFINGDAEIMPPATRALFAALDQFPSTAGVSALEALGVNLLVFDLSSLSAADWGRIAARIETFSGDLTPAATLANAAVYRVAPPQSRFGALLDALPRSSSVCIGGVPPDDPTYANRAALSHFLRDRYVRGTLKTGWTSEPTPLRAGEHCQYGIFALTETIPPGYDPTSPIWSDGMLALFRARSG
jgi:hypothetical protein